MSCPYMHTTKRESSLPQDITGEHARLSEAFEALLPSCSESRKALDLCREDVRQKGRGHCLEMSRAWRACYESRLSLSNSIIQKCSGDDECTRSHSELQKEYILCANKHGTKLTVAAQMECLSPLRDFFQCALSITQKNNQSLPTKA